MSQIRRKGFAARSAVDAITSDRDLIAGARAGDAKALATLLEQQQGRIYRFSMKMCRNEEDAKDVLQDTLLAMVRTVGDFRGRAAVSTWLYTIARSFCIKKRRRSKFAPDPTALVELSSSPEAQHIADPTRGPEEALAGRQLQAALDHAIAALAPAHREVLLLRDVEGLSARDVAKVLGTNVTSVKSRLHRARAAVRERVAPALGIQMQRPGKACPDILRIYSKHLEGDVSGALCARMEQHLAACDHCRTNCDTLQRTLAICRAAPEPAVPAEVQAAVHRAMQTCFSSGGERRRS